MELETKINQKPTQFKNFPGTLSKKAIIYDVNSIEEVRKILATCRQQKRHVRVLAGGQMRDGKPVKYSESLSWSPIGPPDEGEVIIRLSKDGMRNIHINHKEKTVTVGAGCMIEQLEQYLENPHNYSPNHPKLSLTTLGTKVPYPTIGGALANGCNNFGDKIFSDAVVEIELLLANGNLATINKDGISISNAKNEIIEVKKGEQYMRAVSVSLGMLGIITKATFQCEDAFKLKRTTKFFNLDKNPNKLAKKIKTCDQIVWLPYCDGKKDIFIQTFEKVGTHKKNAIPSNKHEASFLWFGELALDCIATFHTGINTFVELARSHQKYLMSHPNPAIGDPSQILHDQHEFPTNIVTTCFAIPMEGPERKRAIEAINFIKNLINKYRAQGKLPIAFEVFGRFVTKTSNTYFAPTQGHQYGTFYLEIATDSRLAYQEIFQEIEKEFLKYQLCRPHWGKHYTALDNKKLIELYGEESVEAFLKVRSELDPTGLFLNDPLCTMFALPSTLKAQPTNHYQFFTDPIKKRAKSAPVKKEEPVSSSDIRERSLTDTTKKEEYEEREPITTSLFRQREQLPESNIAAKYDDTLPSRQPNPSKS